MRAKKLPGDLEGDLGDLAEDWVMGLFGRWEMGVGSWASVGVGQGVRFKKTHPSYPMGMIRVDRWFVGS